MKINNEGEWEDAPFYYTEDAQYNEWDGIEYYEDLNYIYDQQFMDTLVWINSLPEKV